MDLSIIIVNWNSKDYLRECINSILSTTQEINYEIVVIDNASFDGCDEMLQQYYPKVQFIQSERNLGFSKANNAAVKISCGRSLLFLNPDTKLEGSAVNTLYYQLNSLPNAGVVGAKLLNSDRSIQTSCIRTFPTIINQFLDSELLHSLWPQSALWGNAPLFITNTGPMEVDSISGACMMVKREVFDEVGLFSEDYFMFAEDTDLCYKIKQAGYKNYYIPSATVYHFGGGSTQKTQSNFSVVMMRESNLLLMKKNRGVIYSNVYRASSLISALCRIAILIILLPLYNIQQRKGAWRTSIRKWIAILFWSLGFKEFILKYQ